MTKISAAGLNSLHASLLSVSHQSGELRILELELWPLGFYFCLKFEEIIIWTAVSCGVTW